MNTGLLSVRYARALFEAAQKQHNERSVYADMQRLAKCYIEVPRLRMQCCNPLLLKKTKKELLHTALGADASTDLSLALVDLTLKTGREDIIQFIANAYIGIYQKHEHITPARIITASTLQPEQKARMESLIQKKAPGSKVELETIVDRDILGGFILDFDFQRMDASLRNQLNNMRALLEKNK